MKKGILITFEGSEGSGKSTQIRALALFLKRTGKSVLVTREPGGTKISEKIRSVLLDARHSRMDAVCETLLYMASRAQLSREVILPALEKGKVVMCDRFLDATYAYQGCGSGVSIRFIDELARHVTPGIVPDLTILLDIPTAKGLKRSSSGDRIEKKSLSYHKRVRQGYMRLARKHPRRIKVVPASGSISEIQDRIRRVTLQCLRTKLGLTATR